MSRKMRGQAMTEYVIIIAAVGIATIPIMTKFGQALSEKTQEAASVIAGSTDLNSAFNTDNNSTTGNEGFSTQRTELPEQGSEPAQELPTNPNRESNQEPDTTPGETPANESSRVAEIVKDLVKEGVKGVAEGIANGDVQLPADVLKGLGVDQSQVDDVIRKYNELAKDKLKNINIVDTTERAVSLVNGLTDAEKKVEELANAGDFEGAFSTIWSGAAGAVAETVMASKPMQLALDKLGGPGAAILSEKIPELARESAGDLGRQVWKPFGKSVNDRLWQAYHAGYITRKPRIPENYFD